jgi:hypothetical protein
MRIGRINFSPRDRALPHGFQHSKTNQLAIELCRLNDLLSGKIPKPESIDITTFDSTAVEPMAVDPNAPKPRNLLAELIQLLGNPDQKAAA